MTLGKQTRALLAVLASTCFVPLSAQAQMAIDRLWVDLSSASVGRSDLVIRNESEDRYFVTITATEVINPGTPEERKTSEVDPQKLGLLVTPGRLILDPGQLRAIRVVSLNRELARDRVYRVNITPQVGELQLSQTDGQNHGIAIKMLTAFDALVTVRPEEPVRNLVATREGNGLILSNTGNSNVLLLDGEVCPAEGQALTPSTRAWLDQQHEMSAGNTSDADEQEVAGTTETPARGECAKLPGRRLYAGNTWKLPGAPGESLKFDRRDDAGSDLKPITIRCDGIGDGVKPSKFCASADAENAASNKSGSPRDLNDGVIS